MTLTSEQPPRVVLIVDDNQDAADMLASILELTGYEPKVVTKSTSALDYAAREVPFAACLDIGLPMMDGCELARRLRAVPGWDRVLLIAITGYGHVADRERSRAAGIDHHLVKPVPFADLEELLREAI
ncbi:MAG: response regulator [Deltaproteobacteria bacterium]|nr:response regulator [Deltaproteobacteria bacterium]